MNERKWKTQFDRDGRRFSAGGSRIRKTYTPVIDERGSVRLEESGTDDFYSYIQSFADSVDINIILKRFMNGETDVLSKVQGFYADFTGLPKDYASIMNVVNSGKDLFDSLPVEVRAKFGHNFHEFMIALSENKLGEVIGTPLSPAADQGDGSSKASPSPAEKPQYEVLL